MFPDQIYLKSQLCKQRTWSAFLTATALSIASVLPVRAETTARFGLGHLVELTDLIVVADLVASGDKVEAEFVSVLKGQLPEDFRLSGSITKQWSERGQVPMATFAGHPLIEVTGERTKGITFLIFPEQRPGTSGIISFSCVQPAAMKPRILELIAMYDDPAPLVRSRKHNRDLEMIHLLGERFHSLRIEGLDRPGLGLRDENLSEKEQKARILYSLFSDESVPWERTRLTVPFTYVKTRTPAFQLADFKEQGPMPDYIRKRSAGFDVGNHWNLPPTFSATLDTRGPEKVGQLPFAEAAAYLRELVRSGDSEVRSQAYDALARMRDNGTVPLALEMLREPDRKARGPAANFLASAKDPRAAESISTAIDELSPHIPARSEGHDEEEENLASSLAHAAKKLMDPQMLPALKRAVSKGYTEFASVVSGLGD